MKRKLFLSFLAIWTLGIASPAFSFVCSMPCRMDQEQMLDCAKACATEKPATSVGRRACVTLEVADAAVMDAAQAPVQQAPVFVAVQPAQIPVPAAQDGPTSGRPLRNVPKSPPLELPTANAPPQLI